ncbi:bifunctional protein-disulfide isomerase/oxidoreductase DsbC [Thalassotalea fusca]
MRNNLFLGFILFFVVSLGVSHAFNTKSALPEPNAQAQTSAEFVELRANFATTLQLQVISIDPSPIEGLVEVLTNQGLFYASKDGRILVHGRVFGIGEGVVNYTEESLAKVRVKGMKRFADNMIVFPAKEEKHVVTVFTDITCGYCRKMHSEIDEYNAKGITVRYMAYPRSGIRDAKGEYSQGFKDLQSIWCHENPAEALTRAKLGAQVAQRICDSQIEDEFNFGRQVGVSGTPAIMLESGDMLPGYQNPDQLSYMLDQMKLGI